jgi:hypothetical protein
VRKLIGVMAITAALGHALGAENESGAIEGTVVGEDGRPEQKAAVFLNRIGYEGSPGIREFQLRTDRNGYFLLKRLPPGLYSVAAISRDGRVLREISDVRVEAGSVRNLDSVFREQPPLYASTIPFGNAGGLVIKYRLTTTRDSLGLLFRNAASGTVTNTTSLPVRCAIVAPANPEGIRLRILAIRLAPGASQTFSKDDTASTEDMSAMGKLEWEGNSCITPLSYDFANKTAIGSFAGGVVKGLIGDKRIGIVVENNSDQPFEIDWNGSSFVDVDRSAKRIFHSGVRYADREQSLPNTTVPPFSRAEESVSPTERVRYSNGGWYEDPIFPTEVRPGDAETAIRTLRRARVSLFLQLVVAGKKTSVTLTFEVAEVELGVFN